VERPRNERAVDCCWRIASAVRTDRQLDARAWLGAGGVQPSAKHGALSTAGGRVSVTWSVSHRNNHRAPAFEWKGTKGPKATTAATSGFGSALIQSAIPGAEVRREVRGDGFVCTIELELPEPA